MSTKFKLAIFIIVAFFLVGCGDPSEFHVTKVYRVAGAQPRTPLSDAENSVNTVFFVEGYTQTARYLLSCDESLDAPCFYARVGETYHLELMSSGHGFLSKLVGFKEMQGSDLCFTIEKEESR